MFCSKCSAVIKPVVVVDIDGTLGDYHGHFLNFAWQYLGLVGDGKSFTYHAYHGFGSFRDWFREQTKCDERTWYDIKLAYRQGAQKRSMPVYDGAQDLCQNLRSTGAELWLCTTRPFMRLDRIDPDTRFWLDHNGIRYDGLISDEEKYKILDEQIDRDRIVAVLDDEIEQVEKAAAIFGTAIPFIRHNAYNNLCSYPQSVYDLETARATFATRIRQWQNTAEAFV